METFAHGSAADRMKWFQTGMEEIELARSRVYEYYDVPRAIFDHLLTADSKGKLFAARIDGRYKFIEIDRAIL